MILKKKEHKSFNASWVTEGVGPRTVVSRDGKITKRKWRLCDIITGDESWFYLRQIGHNSSNASWVKEDE